MLKLKRIGIDTFRENVVLIARSCHDFRAEEYHAYKKVEVTAADGRQLLATVAIVDDESIVGRDEIGVSDAAFRRLGLGEGAPVAIAPAVPPRSLEAVRAKIRGHGFDDVEMRAIIRDIAGHRYSDMEIAAFLVSAARFMSADEVLSLTRAMADAGNRLSWPVPTVVDKHCIGGIPGNRTTMIIVPIVAAHGLPIPKTSSRAITSAAGTADTMEVLARVDLSTEEMGRVVKDCSGCIVWGGHVNLSPADDILISVERRIGLDIPEQMVASILSKNVAAGSTHVLIDIPVGPTAKIRDRDDALRVKKLFEFVGDKIGLALDVVIYETIEPVGRGIGPVLEARDVMAVLECHPAAPADLRERALQLAGRVLEFDAKLRGGSGYARARELLDSGAALASMRRILSAQGAPPEVPRPARLHKDIPAPADGVVASIDCYRLGRIARLAGAPTDKSAGIDLFKKVGDRTERGEALYRVLSCLESDFRFATEMAADCGYTIAAR
ncbi:MAG TPA: thymidine phosphorylase family protein [Alphaproteobacteria bacterium]